MRYLTTVLLFLVCASLSAEEETQAILQAEITAIPFHSYGSLPDRIQPGSQVKLGARVKNIGTAENAPGTMMIRFAFAHPLDAHADSLKFETEKVALPSIAPGEEFVVTFSKMHRWPSLFDFIREDWAMRQYEAVATVNELDHVIGARSVTFSAYYYEGPIKKQPKKLPRIR